ncbi:hypothetical protein K458DRAFT_309610 [Lentithecium fluviatile CBS 122367]|uniref:ER transporter 6TM N-terminal domain-containing protein n=1 Tax=Lentithecium fluviatile CBS 122367 TaxID=1168545 RepID=A0A6G1ITE0_9PLEO|nr:hypothetical protein K458DRAFT_309610 [Lentithecium fluviatile CBS 122367]
MKGNFEEEKDAGKKEKTPSALGKAWKKLDLDLPTALMMMKAALPPTIALAMYQATDVANTYSTLGYLVAIISILGFCIMPRAKFIQTMTMNVASVCIGAAVSLLELWSSVKAREHTTPPGLPPVAYRYNSSQSAVCGVWLFFQIWIVSTLKAKFPQFAFPTILYAIMVNVASTYGPQFQTVPQAESFVKRLLISFLTGLGIATGVSLFILPTSCRLVVTKEITGYVGALRGALSAHKNYFQSLETKDMFRQTTWTPGPDDKEEKLEKPKIKPEVKAVKKLTGTFTALHGKLHGDLPFAKREIAYGKMTPEDFESIFKHLRSIMMPMVGLGSLVDLFERVADLQHFEDGRDEETPDPELHARMVEDWNDLMKFLHGPFEDIITAMDEGLEHVLIRFGLAKVAKTQKTGGDAADAEAKGDLIKPGDAQFAASLEARSDAFYQGKETTLRHWLESKGIKLRDDFFHNSNADADPQNVCLQRIPTRQRQQRQLYVVLYIMFLLHSISRAILALVKFADEKDQATTTKRFIGPGKRRFRKWISSTFSSQDSSHEDEMTGAGLGQNNTVVYMGEAFRQRKDPEHLAPKNAWEKFGNFIRATSRFLGASESAFGFRCACATMTIAIIGFLHDTQLWFIEQRLVWAMIMVALSMTPTSGAALYSFLLRIVGTVIAMLAAWLIWYIPGQQTAGVIVFVWVFVSLGFYIPLKRMEFLIAGIIGVVTAVMIVGYELEVRKIGRAIAESNGQPAYEIYVLGPYRLATVVGGMFVAGIWTFFPYPITEHSALRQKLGGALYLSANFYSIMHETVMARIRGDEGDLNDKTSPGAKLEKARNKVFAKQMLTLQGLKTHSQMVEWEFPLGGKFPKTEYLAIIGYVTNIVNYTALLGYASNTFTHPSIVGEDTDPSTVQWFLDFRRIISQSNITSHEITSLLSLLSSSITSGQPLPPYLLAPQAFKLAKRLEAVDRDILSLRHITEPGYAAFAVLQISTRCISMDIEKLLNTVKKLVGELDFSFHVVSTQAGSGTSSSETLVKSSSKRSKAE